MLRIDQPAKTHAEIVAEIRNKIVELQGLGVLSGDGAQLYQGQLMILLSSIEQYREKCERQAQQFLEKYHYALGRREAFTMLRSMLEQLMNASIKRAKDAIEREQELMDVEPARITIPEAREPEVDEPTLDQRPADVVVPPMEGVTVEHPCVCGRKFSSKRSLAGHRGRCKEYQNTLGKPNGEAS